MLIIYGWYKWGKKFIGYKKDLCYRCKTKTVWHRLRYFPFVHIFWIPLLPLGVFKEWVCDQCQKSPKPSSSIGGSMIFGILGVPILLLALLVLGAGFTGDSGVLWLGLLMLCISAAIFGYMIYRIRVSRRDKQLREATRDEQDSLLHEPCLYCLGEIQLLSKPACIDCGARVYETVDEFAELKAG